MTFYPFYSRKIEQTWIVNGFVFLSMRFWNLRWPKPVSWRPRPASWPYWFKPIKGITSKNGLFIRHTFRMYYAYILYNICYCEMLQDHLWVHESLNNVNVTMWKFPNSVFNFRCYEGSLLDGDHRSNTRLQLCKSKAFKWYIVNVAKTPTKTLTRWFFRQ